MGLIFRTAIIVGTMAVLSPVHQRDHQTTGPSGTTQLAEAGRDLARRAGDEAAQHLTPALAAAIWTAIEPADRQALARVVLDALVEDAAPPAAKPRRTPQG
jgi:hypothetical protein